MSQKIVLITGANKGIGLEIAKQLAAKNWRVFITARQSEAGLAAVNSLSQYQVSFIPLDVNAVTSISSAAELFNQQANHLDVLINNAGIFESFSNILDMELDSFHRTWLTNTVGPIMVTKAFWPMLEKSSQGRVINISSGLGSLTNMQGQAAAYGISKTALNAVTRQFAAIGWSKGISVNSVCPGWTKSDMGGPNAERSVEQGAETPVWLATEAPSDLTGSFLRDKQVIPW